ncbi:casein kinase ii subunit alpha [Anaeramoeba flamelloides]|uniref:non-specific serine/threonine protein kinase n=1 Tax=Anaeramoeba flamelloides TaxID=1746091 RepID=A0AAV8AHF8_9EUKA|nr:casein kinase ii subunit alpha [Anaeramoeba flamelloides]
MTNNKKKIQPLFSQVNLELGKEHWDYNSLNPTLVNIVHFELLQKLGKGRYASVFLGNDLRNNKEICLKVLKPVKRSKIKREIKISMIVGEFPNTVKLLDLIDNKVIGTPTLVFEYFPHPHILELLPTIAAEEMCLIIYRSLQTLYHAHRSGIMHRDIKPHNVLYDPKSKEVKLVDWGLSEFYFPETAYNCNVASRFFKAPELLIGYTHYHYSIDMWAVGCLIAGWAFSKEPFFAGKNNLDQLGQIVKILGASKFWKWTKSIKFQVRKKIIKSIPQNGKKMAWKDLNPEIDPQICEILDGLLNYDFNKRWNVVQTMAHPWFDSVRSEGDIDSKDLKRANVSLEREKN